MARRSSSGFDPNRREVLGAFLFGGLVTLTGCQTDGHFSLFGYTTRPNYDSGIHTVYVPMFRTKMLETTPYRDMEMTLHRKVVNAIEQMTPFKVLSDSDRADTELQVTVISLRKVPVNRTPFNELREIELTLSVEVVWHDLRPGNEGKILTNPRRRGDRNNMIDGPFDPANPPLPPGPDVALPVVITDYGRGIFELGETSTSALDMAMKRVSQKICNAMEQPW